MTLFDMRQSDDTSKKPSCHRENARCFYIVNFVTFLLVFQILAYCALRIYKKLFLFLFSTVLINCVCALSVCPLFVCPAWITNPKRKGV